MGNIISGDIVGSTFGNREFDIFNFFVKIGKCITKDNVNIPMLSVTHHIFIEDEIIALSQLFSRVDTFNTSINNINQGTFLSSMNKDTIYYLLSSIIQYKFTAQDLYTVAFSSQLGYVDWALLTNEQRLRITAFMILIICVRSIIADVDPIIELSKTDLLLSFYSQLTSQTLTKNLSSFSTAINKIQYVSYYNKTLPPRKIVISNLPLHLVKGAVKKICITDECLANTNSCPTLSNIDIIPTYGHVLLVPGVYITTSTNTKIISHNNYDDYTYNVQDLIGKKVKFESDIPHEELDDYEQGVNMYETVDEYINNTSTSNCSCMYKGNTLYKTCAQCTALNSQDNVYDGTVMDYLQDLLERIKLMEVEISKYSKVTLNTTTVNTKGVRRR